MTQARLPVLDLGRAYAALVPRVNVAALPYHKRQALVQVELAKGVWHRLSAIKLGDGPVRSLVILSLPLSLSSLIFEACGRLLGLTAAPGTSSGEILNPDRMAAYRSRTDLGMARYVTRDRFPSAFARAFGILDELIQHENYVYKDVLQPFVFSEWLRSRTPDIAVLKIVPNLVDVAYGHLERRDWYGPAGASRLNGDLYMRVCDGLIRSAAQLADCAGEAVHYDHLIEDDSSLREALERLYPDQVLSKYSYVDRNFALNRGEVVARRARRSYAVVGEAINACSFNLPFNAKRLVEFAYGRAGRALLWDGWAESEVWGTWTLGTRSSFNIPVDHWESRALQISLLLVGCCNADNPLEFSVNIDGLAPIRRRLSNTRPCKINIAVPRESVGATDCVVVTINLMNPMSPAALGLNDDDRLLGVGLISASLSWIV